MTDRIFHHYQLGRLLGGGWLGPVHAAADLDENREVALRILDDASSGQSFLIMQLERLLLKVGSLRHPNILPTGALEQRDRRAFYAMDLGQQGSARQLLQGQARAAQPLPVVTAVDLIRQAAAGLAYAHDQGLMHGNLKPENLILQPGRTLLGHTGYVTQLSDFGLAELRAGSYGTHDRAVVNALAYMSPEQCRGIRNELRTDLYALGLILYELLTGLVPFDIRDAAEALEKHQHVAPRQPSLLRPDLPPALEEIILTCLAKDPQDRYAGAPALEAALQEVLNGLMPGGPEPTVRLSALPVMPPAPGLDGHASGPEPTLLVFSERLELLRSDPVTQASFTVGRAPDNAVKLEHVGVSRHHLNVEFTGGQAHVTELTATNGTVMDGLPLTPMTRLRWPYRTPLYLRPYWLVLLEPQQAPARPRIVVKPERDRVTLTPGTPLTLHVMLANTGPTVDHFRVDLRGIPAEWVQGAHTEVQLNPGMQGGATLTLLAPRHSDSRAGDYDVTVVAHSREDPAQTGQAPLAVTVEPFHELVATMLPPVRRTWRHARYTVRLENRGNTDEAYHPRLRDNEGQLRILPRLHDLMTVPQVTTTGMPVDPTQLARETARQATAEARYAAVAAARQAVQGQGRIRVTDLPARLPLGAGQSAEETLKVRVPLRWLGAPSQHQMHVDVFPELPSGESGEHPAAQASAELNHLPLIPLWMLPIVLILLGVLIWLLTRPPQITQFDRADSDTVVRPGTPFTLRWDTQNATRVTIPELGAAGRNLPRDGQLTVPGITRDQKYTLTARSLLGRTVINPQTVQARFDRPEIQTFEVTPARVAGNQKVTIRWQVRNAQQVTISELGKVPASGTRRFSPSRDTTFTLTAQNGTERETDTRSVTVLGPQVKTFKLEPAEIERGGSAVLSWNVQNASTVMIEGLGIVPARGKKTVKPRESTSYTITASGANNLTNSANARLEITSPAPEFLNFEIDPSTVRSDQTFTIRWKTKNASSVNVQYGSGTEDNAPEGQTIKPAPTTDVDIILTARNDAGDQVTVKKPLKVTPVDAEAERKKAEAEAAAAAEKAAAEAEKAAAGKVTFTAQPATIVGEGDVTLNWNAQGFETVTILPLKGPQNGKFDASGSEIIEKVNTTRTYRLVLYLKYGKPLEIERTVKVTPRPVEFRTFKASATDLGAPGPVTLSWDVANTPAVRIAGLSGPLPGGKWPARGSTTLNVPKTRTFVLSVGALQKSVTVRVKPPTPVITFSAAPTQLTGGGTAVLTWSVRNASTVRIDGVRGPNTDGSWPATGRTTLPVKATRTFTLRAGNVTKTASVTVTPAPQARVNSFTASSAALSAPGPVRLRWSVSNASSVRISGVPQTLAATGETTVNVGKTTTFVLTAGSAQASRTVIVKPSTVTTSATTPGQDSGNVPPARPATPVISYFSAKPASIRAGGSATLSWKVTGTDSVTIEGAGGSLRSSGILRVSPAQTTTYTLVAGNVRSEPVTVTVTSAATQVSEYSDLIGSWTHPFGYLTFYNIEGRRATGTFASERDDIPDLPINVIFSGGTLTITSPKLDTFKIVASIDAGRKILRGPYTLQGQSERWCAYRPTVQQPADCR
ncbi:hypothetical protein GCM10008959_17200 [Deinococcus seoulensis]|uniref:Serine/threonine protein kinase n=1 Tax=Deinococcus seoulensis TaxID=1837379 RepID=A0ABQ2RRU5_9DEIO|nr:FHA domain-containing serine/threonine-protein kinase [Deinococcus seoulensis]GGR56128.1 hypothetical protein GCM10008959_17200 [Deinococcus seoulensis]